MKHRALGPWLALASLASACQSYDFVYQPDSDRHGLHLRFVVRVPAKADILLVIDNSGSMYPRQAALKNSITDLLAALAPQDTSYRIGIVSTDAYGGTWDCAGQPLIKQPGFDPSWLPGARGNCERPEVLLARPHDGAAGRLMAAYDPVEFDPDHPATHLLRTLLTTPEERAAFVALRPTGPATGPTGLHGERGVRFVIDRDSIQAEACTACESIELAGVCAPAADGRPPTCTKGSPCFDQCAGPVAAALVTAYFRSNVNGLGIDGSGYEMGLLGGLLALGIDPSQSDDASAVNPPGTLAAFDGANTFTELGPSGSVVGSWLRPDAMLGLMLISDEEDCSMPIAALDQRDTLESGATPPQPEASMCYQHGQNGLPDVQGKLMYAPARLARLLGLKKGSAARIAVGLIGGLRQQGSDAHPDHEAAPADCVSTDRLPLQADGQPSSHCSCAKFALPADGDQWCAYTLDTSLPSAGLPSCDGMAAHRYVEFAAAFGRRSFDSICRAGGSCLADDECGGRLCIDNQCTKPCTADADCGLMGFCSQGACGQRCATFVDCRSGRTCEGGVCVSGYGPELARFASIAGSNCFDLDAAIQPADGNPAYITVRRTPATRASQGGQPEELPRVDPGAATAGWYYEADDNRVCLNGVERQSGDVYDLFVLTRDYLDKTH